MSERVLVGMASIPERVESLERVVASLAPQADRLVVSLNGYGRPPGFLSRYRNVEVRLPGDVNGGDAEKFAAVDDWDGFVATVDDDVLYPADYVETLVAGIERYGRRRAVSFHGGTTAGWNARVHGAATVKRIRCLGELAADDTDVNVLGTGVLGYHTDHVPLWRDVFRSANMADVWFACHAHRLGVQMVALAHREGWLRDIQPPGPSIYESNRAADGSTFDTREARKRELDRIDWAARPSALRVRVSIATCGRPEKLCELLGDLAVESGWADLEVAVYEDPDGSNYTAAREMCLQRGWSWHRFDERLARRHHWQLVDQELRDAEGSDADWFLFLPDDVRLRRHAIPRAISIWGRLEDPATLTLWRLQSLEGLTNWTGKPAVAHPDATEVFHVDGLYLCRRDTLAELGFRCADSRPGRRTGSGVGRLISLTLDRAGKRMYRVDDSLVTCNDDGISMMNPVERIRNPAVAL